MALQNTVYTTQALGKAGTISRLNPCVKIPVIAEGGDVVAGGFVVEGTNPETQVKGLSSATSSVTSVAGLAVFEQFQPALNISSMASMKINEGETLVKLLSGFAFVMSSTASTHGQVVGVNTTTGVIATADDAASLDSGFIDTGWKVETGNAANQVCEIYKL